MVCNRESRRPTVVSLNSGSSTIVFDPDNPPSLPPPPVDPGISSGLRSIWLSTQPRPNDGSERFGNTGGEGGGEGSGTPPTST